MPAENVAKTNLLALRNELIFPFVKSWARVAADPVAFSAYLHQMAAARLAIGGDIVSLRGMSGASAHQLVFGVPMYFVRLWNVHAQPDVPEGPAPSNRHDDPHFEFRLPADGVTVNSFLEAVAQFFGDFNPMSLHAELTRE